MRAYAASKREDLSDQGHLLWIDLPQLIEIARSAERAKSRPVPAKSEAAHLAGWMAQTEYLAEYSHGGSRWAFNFFAIDADDAKRKIEGIKASLELLGPLECRIPAD